MKAPVTLFFGSCLVACQSQIPIGDSDRGSPDASLESGAPIADSGGVQQDAGSLDAAPLATPQVVGTITNIGPTLAVDATNVYVGPDYQGPITVVPLDGTLPFSLEWGAGTGMAIDAVNVYSVGPDNIVVDAGVIYSCAKSGCNDAPTVIASGPPVSLDLAIDSTSVYWTFTSIDAGGVMRAPLAGGASITLTSTPAIHIALANGFVYFVNERSNSDVISGEMVLRVPTAGGETSVFASTPGELATPDDAGLGLPGSIQALAADSTNLYYATASGGLVQAPLDGSAQVVLAPADADGFNGQVAVGGGYVYWARGRTISKVAVGGGPIVPLAPPETFAPISIALDDTSVYWGEPVYVPNGYDAGQPGDSDALTIKRTAR